MPRRYRISLPARNLFSNVTIESGRTDDDIVRSGRYLVPHKTFARLRLNPPASATADQLLLIARLVQRHTPFSAADYLSLARSGEGSDRTGLWALAVSRTKSRNAKDLAAVDHAVHDWLPNVRRIYLFDRCDSFAYLRPPATDEDSQVVCDPVTVEDSVQSFWADTTARWRYDRGPRISVTLAASSIGSRLSRHGDAGIEALIGNVESGEHSLTIVNDDARTAHRVFRGVFADATAVAVFDTERMIVLPSHGHAIRTYDATVYPSHRSLLEQTVRQLSVMRRFRSCGPLQRKTTAFLHRRLSYRLPNRTSA